LNKRDGQSLTSLTLRANGDNKELRDGSGQHLCLIGVAIHRPVLGNRNIRISANGMSPTNQ